MTTIFILKYLKSLKYDFSKGRFLPALTLHYMLHPFLMLAFLAILFIIKDGVNSHLHLY